MKPKENDKRVNIPKTPEKREPKLQTQEERNQRLNNWEVLLSDLPNCDLIKIRNKVIDGYIRDNSEEFGNSIFVVSTSADLNYHPEAYLFLYFMFNNDGKVRIGHDGNIQDYPDLNDHVANKLFEAYDKCASCLADSWPKGYEKILKILENSFNKGVSEVPEKK